MNFTAMTTPELVAYWALVKPTIDTLLGKIAKSVKIISSPQGKTPFMLLDEFDALWEQNQLSELQRHLFVRIGEGAEGTFADIFHTHTTFKRLNDTLREHEQGLHEAAITLVNLHATIRQRVVNRILQRTADKAPAAFASEDAAPNPFIKDLTPHLLTWLKLSSRLDEIYNQLDLATNQHSQIAHLLNPSDEDFLNSVENNTLEMKGEIGYLTLARLSQISVEAQHLHKIRAICLLKRSETLNMFEYDQALLSIEIKKLLLHAKMYPNHKIVLLGTASAINHAITPSSVAAQPDAAAVYLNCEDANWSWGLNRAYIQVAAHLGYRFQMVEQQYPDVLKAMSTADTASLLVAIAREIRAGEPVQRSQYDRGKRCSASAEEYLLLSDMGFSADAALVFKRQAVGSPVRLSIGSGRGRRNSVGSPSATPSADAPTVRFNPFTPPPSSNDIRTQANQGDNTALLIHVKGPTSHGFSPFFTGNQIVADAGGSQQGQVLKRNTNQKIVF